jgi:hypothetical protein
LPGHSAKGPLPTAPLGKEATLCFFLSTLTNKSTNPQSVSNPTKQVYNMIN